MKETLNRIYGLLITQEKHEQTRIFNAIEPRFNKLLFHKHIYEVIEKLINENKEIDVVSVNMAFRERGIWSAEISQTISSICNNTNSIDFLTVNQSIALLKHEQNKRQAQLLCERLTEQINSDNFTTDYFLNALNEEIEAVQIEAVEEKTNVDLIFNIIERHNKAKQGIKTGVNLGFFGMDEAINLEPVDMCVIGARPGMGKTAFAVQVAINLAFNQNKKVAFFSLEMSAEQMMRRIIGNLANVDTMKIKFGNCSDEEIKRIYGVQQLDQLNNIKLFEGSHNVRQISIAVNEMKLNGGVDLIIIDYLQKVIPNKGENRYQQVTQISNGIKFISQNMKIPTLCLAQLSRDSAKLGKRPSLPDLKESGEIEQDASIVGFLHRPEYYGEMSTIEGNDAANVCEFLIGKNREGILENYELIIDLKTSKFMT